MENELPVSALQGGIYVIIIFLIMALGLVASTVYALGSSRNNITVSGISVGDRPLRLSQTFHVYNPGPLPLTGVYLGEDLIVGTHYYRNSTGPFDLPAGRDISVPTVLTLDFDNATMCTLFFSWLPANYSITLNLTLGGFIGMNATQEVGRLSLGPVFQRFVLSSSLSGNTMSYSLAYNFNQSTLLSSLPVQLTFTTSTYEVLASVPVSQPGGTLTGSFSLKAPASGIDVWLSVAGSAVLIHAGTPAFSFEGGSTC